MSSFHHLCNIPFIWLCTSHSAVQPLAGHPRVTQQLDGCACLPYRLRYELLERHARRAQALLHCIKMTQHSTQEGDVSCFCVFCVLQQTFPDAEMDFWRLICPMTCLQIQQKVGPVKSACHICPAQVSVHQASLEYRKDRPSIQIYCATFCQNSMYQGQGADAWCIVAKQGLHQGCMFHITGEVVWRD